MSTRSQRHREPILDVIEGEPAEVYDALQTLAATPPHQRELADLAKRTGRNVRTLYRWRDRWNWAARLAAYDARGAQQQLSVAAVAAEGDEREELIARLALIKQYEQQARTLHSSALSAAVAIYRKVLPRIELLDAKDLDARAIAQLLNAASRTSAVAMEGLSELHGIAEFTAWAREQIEDAPGDAEQELSADDAPTA